MFSDDRVRIYDVEPWAELGFGIPNWGDNPITNNKALHRLVDEIGRAQLGIMTHVDARRRKPPSLNTLQRIFKLLQRSQSVLLSRMAAYNEIRIEGGHSDPGVEAWIIHPCPYFNSQTICNGWLREWNQLIMMAVGHIMQHSDANLPFTVTKELVTEVWQWLGQVKKMAAMELLLIPRTQAEEENWWPDDTNWTSYDPLKVITSFEAMDDPGNILNVFSEDDLRPLLQGIPADLIRWRAPALPTLRPTLAGAGAGERAGAGAAAAAPLIGKPEV